MRSVAAIVCVVTVACGGPDAAIKQRLQSPAPLTRGDIAQLLAATNRAMGGRVPLLRLGAVARQMDEKERNAVFNVLADARALEDTGLETIDGAATRGLRAPATSPQSLRSRQRPRSGSTRQRCCLAATTTPTQCPASATSATS